MIAVHQLADVADIDVHRTIPDAAPAADALDAVVVLVHVIFEFVHEALAHPLHLFAPGIVPGAMKGEQREHAAVPVAHANAGFSLDLVLNVEAPAGRTNIGAGAAIDAGKGHLFPEGRLEQVGGFLVFQAVG